MKFLVCRCGHPPIDHRLGCQSCECRRNEAAAETHAPELEADAA